MTGQSASPKRRFGAYAPRCRQIPQTDARIKGLGTEIADEYALLRDSYRTQPPAPRFVDPQVGVGPRR